MVLHSFFLDCFSTFNSLLASSSQRASRLSWLFRLFQLFAALPQVCSAVACVHMCSEFQGCEYNFGLCAHTCTIIGIGVLKSSALSQSFISFISLSVSFYSHLIWLQPSLTTARSFSVFFSASFTWIITITMGGNNVEISLASHVIFHRHLFCPFHFYSCWLLSIQSTWYLACSPRFSACLQCSAEPSPRTNILT